MVLALCLLTPTTGAIALSYAFFQRRSFWQFTAGFAAFNVLFLMGFMNFALGMGIAMWGAAAWVEYRDKKLAIAIFSGLVIGIVVFFFHLMGFCFYALLVGCYEFFAIADRGLTAPGATFRPDQPEPNGYQQLPAKAAGYSWIVMTLPLVDAAGASASEICLPSTFFWIAASTRPLNSS